MSKKKYLCIQRSESGCDGGAKLSPAQMEEMFAKFTAWKDKFAANIVDLGGMLGGGKVVKSDGETDGPFAETKEIVGGYMVLQAESVDEAARVAQESPGVSSPGSSIEVREITTP